MSSLSAEQPCMGEASSSGPCVVCDTASDVMSPCQLWASSTFKERLAGITPPNFVTMHISSKLGLQTCQPKSELVQLR